MSRVLFWKNVPFSLALLLAPSPSCLLHDRVFSGLDSCRFLQGAEVRTSVCSSTCYTICRHLSYIRIPGFCFFHEGFMGRYENENRTNGTSPSFHYSYVVSTNDASKTPSGATNLACISTALFFNPNSYYFVADSSSSPQIAFHHKTCFFTKKSSWSLAKKRRGTRSVQRSHKKNMHAPSSSKFPTSKLLLTFPPSPYIYLFT